MTNETILEVARKLIGPIEPVADAAIDSRRLENLKTAMAVAQGLLDESSLVVELSADAGSDWYGVV